MTDIFTECVTIYNDIPSDGVNPRRFDRYVIRSCNIQSGTTQTSDGTIERVVNAQTVTTTDVNRYLKPSEYDKIPMDLKENFYTVRINDFVVFGEVDDVVTTAREFLELQSKYAKNGFSVTAVNAYIFGMSVDNIQIIHA